MRHLKIAWALLRFYRRLIPEGWYRRAPFLPIPPQDYMRWRMQTAYGKQRPPIGTILRDIWRLGDWMRAFPTKTP